MFGRIKFKPVQGFIVHNLGGRPTPLGCAAAANPTMGSIVVISSAIFPLCRNVALPVSRKID
jgi:hypothetical protein